MVNVIAKIDRCREGDTDAFRYIVSQYQQMIFTLAFRLLCDEEDAKDATQETFIKIWQNISNYKKQYKFTTWIYKIAVNVCYDKLRLEQKITKVELRDCDLYSNSNPEEHLYEKELKAIIKEITSGLPPKQKLVFTLCEIEELDTGEISVITGLTPRKIKSNLYLAKQYVKLKIEEYESSRKQ